MPMDQNTQSVANAFNQANWYNGPRTFYNTAGTSGANLAGLAGRQLGIQGYGNLLTMLKNQGRVDPRLLAAAQARNAQSTQQQQGAARGASVRGGFGNSGLGAAIQAAIGSAGANRASNLNYQDLADSYGRNQQNLGLLNDLVLNQQRDYAAIGTNQYSAERNNSNQRTGAMAQGVGSLIGAIAGACRVARELYGEDSQEFKDARAYVVSGIPADLALKYVSHGDELAAAVKSDPALRERLTPVFDEFARRGRAGREA